MNLYFYKFSVEKFFLLISQILRGINKFLDAINFRFAPLKAPLIFFILALIGVVVL